MTQIGRKARIRRYKETLPPAGVFRVRNTATGKSLVGSSANLPGTLNRHRFQLERGSHPSRELQADWSALGPDAFEFEVLDQLKPSDKPDLQFRCARLPTGYAERSPIREDRAYGHIKKLDGDDAKEGSAPVQIEMLLVRARNRSVL